jgi:hypothetical protein
MADVKSADTPTKEFKINKDATKSLPLTSVEI